MFSLIILAGTPPTIVYAGISLVTKDPAAITTPSPICTPFIDILQLDILQLH